MFDGLRENFEIVLVALFLLSLISYVIYRLTFYKNIKADLCASKSTLEGMKKKERKQIQYGIINRHTDSFYKKFIYFFADLFWVILFVFVFRSFVFEPFVIPSSSMKPGLQINDVVLVNKYELGLRMPITNTKMTEGRKVERGDVIVFKYPNDLKRSYIKRVIGLPGDTVYYDNRKMTINGKPVVLKPIGKNVDTVEFTDEANGNKFERDVSYSLYQENLDNKEHIIRYADSFSAPYPAREWVVPNNKYLVMGDNRDNSADGRDFGLLEDKLLIGKASRILLNFDCFIFDGKCDRFFKTID